MGCKVLAVVTETHRYQDRPSMGERASSQGFDTPVIGESEIRSKHAQQIRNVHGLVRFGKSV